MAKHLWRAAEYALDGGPRPPAASRENFLACARKFSRARTSVLRGVHFRLALEAQPMRARRQFIKETEDPVVDVHLSLVLDVHSR